MASTWQDTKRQLRYFLIIGIFATFLDFFLYSYWHQHMAYSLAKMCSFLTGTIVVYFLNKFLTFQQKKHSIPEACRFFGLYFLSLCMNVFVNSACIWLCMHLLPTIWQNWSREALIFSFLAATGVSTIINFFGQKFWVFGKIGRKI